MIPVWITGVGAATPLGHDTPAIAAALVDGRSPISRVTKFDVETHASQIAAELTDLPGRPLQLDQLIEHCCQQALRGAGLAGRDLRVGVVLGVACEWLCAWEREGTVEGAAGSTLNEVAARNGWTGPVVTLSAACASGNVALAIARNWLRQGLVDVCLAGGCDLAVTPLTLAGFGNLRALSRRNDSPAQASRPFDRDRDGFVLGEGGVVLALERAGDARVRGAAVLAELAGVGLTSDAFHLVAPDPEGHGAEAAIRAALADARIRPDQLDYVNAHGPGTPAGDRAEALALQRLLGPAVGNVPVSSTKGTSGHLLTAAAALEAVAGIVALNRQVLPPTINLDDPDPVCRLDHVANVARERRVAAVLSNSFGFGGSNTAIVLKRAA